MPRRPAVTLPLVPRWESHHDGANDDGYCSITRGRLFLEAAFFLLIFWETMPASCLLLFFLTSLICSFIQQTVLNLIAASLIHHHGYVSQPPHSLLQALPLGCKPRSRPDISADSCQSRTRVVRPTYSDFCHNPTKMEESFMLGNAAGCKQLFAVSHPCQTKLPCFYMLASALQTAAGCFFQARLEVRAEVSPWKWQPVCSLLVPRQKERGGGGEGRGSLSTWIVQLRCSQATAVGQSLEVGFGSIWNRSLLLQQRLFRDETSRNVLVFGCEL